jgi:DNA mismatch repair protein MutL
MGQRVRILPEQLANKIAAGEVVERPASVVKELVENSIDALATEIIVEIEDGGKRLIKVTDNGCGMSRDDALMSLERHATSKISSDSDLFRLATLGFRGEAMPSIASVSRFSIASREHESVEGVEIYAEGGSIREVKACGMAPGTSISVRSLFYNTPARLKFMKSRETETGHIGEVLNRLALSRPDIRFVASFDGNVTSRFLAGEMAARAKEVMGAALAKELYPFESEKGPVALRGLLGSPSVTRSTASSIYTFINGRYIRDRVVQHSLMQAYRNVIERGRYPVLALFLTIPSEDVDVNVHPTKHEVRFREQSVVHAAIQSAVEELLRDAPWARQPAERRLFSQAPAKPYGESISRVGEVKDALLRYASKPHSAPAFQASHPSRIDSGSIPSAPDYRPDDSKVIPSGGYFSSLDVIGQFSSSYILCQDEDDLVIIDQHAAHERVVFETLRNNFARGRIEGQRLLFPETFELSPSESAVIEEHRETLGRLAFDLEHFGGSTWLLSGIPLILSGQEYLKALRDIIEELGGVGSTTVINDKVEEMLSTVACHSVVRGKWQLSGAEIRNLLQGMDITDFAGNCPHGRPAVAKITRREIEKLFKRT